MGVRPPQRDAEDPTSIEFGIAALDARLEEGNVTFPATADEVVRSLDDPAIPLDPAGSTISLDAALDHVDSRRFESRRELLNELHPVFESHREGVSSGLLGSLRGMLPF